MRASIFVALTLAATSVFAYESGNELLADLESEDAFFRVRANSFIVGTTRAFRDGFIVGYTKAEKTKSDAKTVEAALNVGFCIPAGVTVGQLGDVTKKYLQNNPTERHERSTALIVFSARKAFPCFKD